MTRALLVGLSIDESYDETLYSLEELKKLSEVLGILVIDKIIQPAKIPTNAYYIGSGKVLEIKNIISVLDINMVIFDTTLSPAQLRNLEKALDTEIMDRSFLILQIFALRAKTKEAMLEVSLAQKKYMLPRLVGINKSLSRQGGSSGSFNAKGPGETKLELDRRKLTKEIARIKKELLKIAKEKEIGKKKRLTSGIPIVALVGYTNAGKSSTMNSLATILTSNNESVLEKDQLFATLDTKVKRLRKENESPFLLIDTVGFVSKLPHELINSFKSTLKDTLDADLLLQIVDGSGDAEKEIRVTNEVLQEINATSIERLLVLTKKDLAFMPPRITDDYFFISNTTKEGIDELIHAIYTHINKNNISYYLNIPYDKGSIINDLKNNHKINSLEYLDNYIRVNVVLSKEKFATLKQYGG